MMSTPANAQITRPNASATIADNEKELLRVNRALKTLSAGNRTLLRAGDEGELVNAMCRVIVEQGGYRMSYVGYVQHDERKSVSLAAFGFDDHYEQEEETLRNLYASWADNEFGHSVTGTSIRTGKPCIVRHLLTDPDHAPWRAEALRFRYESASAFPLHVDGEVIGTLGIAASDPDAFDEAEVKLLAELADDLAYGISNLRSRLRRQEAEATIHRMAYCDALTGLPNRASLCERFESVLATAVAQNQPLALMIVSLDHLQEVNDTLGYAQGDRLIQTFARRLIEAELAETVARVGEGEFALLLPNADSARSSATAQQLSKLLHTSIDVEGLAFDVHTHTGLALFPGHGADAEVLLRRARVAMRDAMQAGRDYAVFAPALDQEASRRLALMGELRHAIERHQLALQLQPKLHLASAAICGAEALVRWKHPLLGQVPTFEFITLAEQAGMITPVTHWVLEATFRERYAWHMAGIELPLSVNLSAHDLRDPTLLDKLKGLVETWGAKPGWIQLELTESALMVDASAAVETLHSLKRLGFQLAIDDFGAGYSSLGYLHRLPVDAIKIDQSFVIPLVQNEDCATIVSSAAQMAHKLGFEVVAEGVESQDALRRVTELGCDIAQGHFVSHPMAADQFGAWRAASPWSSPASLAH